MKPGSIPAEQHRRLRDDIRAALVAEGQEAPALLPGDEFQPAYLTFSSRPTADSFWFIRDGAIVSARVKALFEANRVTGIAFVPATVEKIGRRVVTAGVPSPRLEELEEAGPFYEMVIVTQSGQPLGAEITSHCDVCDRDESDTFRRRLVLTEAMLPGTDVFRFATTLWIVVGAKVRDLIAEHALTNVRLRDLPLADPLGAL